MLRQAARLSRTPRSSSSLRTASSLTHTVAPVEWFPPPRKTPRMFARDDEVDANVLSDRYRVLDTSAERSVFKAKATNRMELASSELRAAVLPVTIPGLNGDEEKFIRDQMKLLSLVHPKMLRPRRNSLEFRHEMYLDSVATASAILSVDLTPSGKCKEKLRCSKNFACPVTLRRLLVGLKSYDVGPDQIAEHPVFLAGQRGLDKLSDDVYVARRLEVSLMRVKTERSKAAMRGSAVRDHIADLSETLGSLGLNPESLKNVSLGKR